MHTSTPTYPLSCKFCSCLNENMFSSYFSLKDKVIILSPSKCAVLTFERSAVKYEPLTGCDPPQSPYRALPLKAALAMEGKKKITILSFPSQLQKVFPVPLFLAAIISRNFLHSCRKCCAFKGKRSQFWLFRQDLSKALMYKSFCFPKSAAPKVERQWTYKVEMNVPMLAG